MINYIGVINNPGSIKDGIGLYGQKMAEAVEQNPQVEQVFIEGAYTADYGKLKKLLSFKMTAAIRKALKRGGALDSPVVVTEYPFQEYNPLILPFYSKLQKSLHKQNGLVILSLHEYLRANIIRKRVVEILAKHSDIVYVTDEQTRNKIVKWNKNTYLREIPSVISFPAAKSARSNKDCKNYVFMGLVNSSKAFYEMISAWKVFNSGRKCSLDIYTSSKVTVPDAERFNIYVHIGKEDQEIIDAMQKAAFCICPIKPSITKANSSFTTACLAGCITIGVASNFLNNESFTIKMKDYSEDSFIKAMQISQNLSGNTIEVMGKEALDFAIRTSKTHAQIAEEILYKVQAVLNSK